MNRRTVLQSLAAATAATAPALAGCGGDVGQNKTCDTPNDDLTSALPRGGEFGDPSIDENNSATEVGGAKQHVIGGYITDDDENLLFVIGEYELETRARGVASNGSHWESFGYETTGYIVVEEYAYVVMGPSESKVQELMARAGPLNSECVKDEITFL